MDIFSVLVGVGTTALVKGEIAKFLSIVFATTPEMIAETINNEFQLFNKKRTYETLIKIYSDLKNKGVEPNKVTKKILVPLLLYVRSFLKGKGINTLLCKVSRRLWI